MNHSWTWITAAILLFGSCTTTELTPDTPPAAQVPEYLHAPHPAGFDLFDLRSLLLDKQAPKDENHLACEEKVKKLKSLTLSQEEFRQGVRELVRASPVYYHWCFYGKLVLLEDQIKVDKYLDEKQKLILDVYGIVVPIARGFLLEFKDSRYLRWAVRHYRQLSETVFFRKLDVSPQMTQELVDVANPFGFVRNQEPERPVLEKYGLEKKSGAEIQVGNTPENMMVPHEDNEEMNTKKSPEDRSDNLDALDIVTSPEKSTETTP